MVATIAGAFVGGWVTTLAGLGHSLWIFGFLQVFSNVGYFLVSQAGGPNLPLMYAATSFELLTSGMGTGAFSVLLLRMTQKRFSATQYALFSSLFALPRLLAGPDQRVRRRRDGLADVLPVDARHGHPRARDAAALRPARRARARSSSSNRWNRGTRCRPVRSRRAA